MKKAIIAISGGIDSAVAAAIAKNEGYDLFFLTVNYGQKNLSREIENTKYLAKWYDAREHLIINMEWLGSLGTSLVTDDAIDDISKELIYVPNRNTCIISACLAWAETIDADVIYTGSEAGPWVCPDNSPEYYEKWNKLISISMMRNKKVSVVAPLNYSDKTNNVRIGLNLGVPYQYTWSCLCSDTYPCGKCLSCQERAKAFADLDQNDPLFDRLNLESSR